RDGQKPRITTRKPSDVWRDAYGAALRFRGSQPAADITTSFSLIREMEQDTGAVWQKVEYTFEDYPRGIRYVVFEHAGKDKQVWAGHYGAKMAKATVIVNYGTGKRRGA
ncbi:unnamed protein product, partial [Gongylonema pulchrum]|uniref:FBA domain-containing protein n=1 Tax=Gongylonema pulchrum TaxID=637853 RepID=A0A183DA07_9BILA